MYKSDFSETMMIRTSIVLGVGVFIAWFFLEYFFLGNSTISSLWEAFLNGAGAGILCVVSMGFTSKFLEGIEDGMGAFTVMFLSILAGFTLIYIVQKNIYIVPLFLIPPSLVMGFILDENESDSNLEFLFKLVVALIIMNGLAINLVFGPKYSLFVLLSSFLFFIVSLIISRVILELWQAWINRGKPSILSAYESTIGKMRRIRNFLFRNIEKPLRWILDRD